MYTPNEAEQKVIDALRSGKYTQTTGRLHDNHGYCCLGVACEVLLGADKWSPRVVSYNDDESTTIYIVDNAESELPESVRIMLGWASNDGELDADAECSSLIDCNDEERMSFPEIADIIEQGHVSRESDWLIKEGENGED